MGGQRGDGKSLESRESGNRFPEAGGGQHGDGREEACGEGADHGFVSGDLGAIFTPSKFQESCRYDLPPRFCLASGAA